MASNKTLKLAQKSMLLQRDLLLELDRLVKSFNRGDELITQLKAEMEAVNLKHKDRKTTRDDIAYLEDLLWCAKKKLAWEKQMEKLRVWTPDLLKRVSEVINDPANPPSDQTRAVILQALQQVQTAMERLEQSKIA